jgi:hypothetical protein
MKTTWKWTPIGDGWYHLTYVGTKGEKNLTRFRFVKNPKDWPGYDMEMPSDRAGCGGGYADNLLGGGFGDSWRIGSGSAETVIQILRDPKTRKMLDVRVSKPNETFGQALYAVQNKLPPKQKEWFHIGFPERVEGKSSSQADSDEFEKERKSPAYKAAHKEMMKHMHDIYGGFGHDDE